MQHCTAVLFLSSFDLANLVYLEDNPCFQATTMYSVNLRSKGIIGFMTSLYVKTLLIIT